MKGNEKKKKKKANFGLEEWQWPGGPAYLPSSYCCREEGQLRSWGGVGRMRSPRRDLQGCQLNLLLQANQGTKDDLPAENRDTKIWGEPSLWWSRKERSQVWLTSHTRYFQRSVSLLVQPRGMFFNQPFGKSKFLSSFRNSLKKEGILGLPWWSSN